jgi:P-type Cu2+ transporter
MSDTCFVQPVSRQITAEEYAQSRTLFLTIQGINCPNCATRVYNGLASLPGVTEAEVNQLSSQARVVFNPDLVSPSTLLDAVAQAGDGGHHNYQAVIINY